MKKGIFGRAREELRDFIEEARLTEKRLKEIVHFFRKPSNIILKSYRKV